MSRSIIAACALVALPAAAWAQTPAVKPAAPPGAEFALDKERVVLAPLTHGNLAVFPVVIAGEPKRQVDYLVLDEGMKAGSVVVVEKGEGADVNQLELRNKSNRPLFLLAGEVVIGGKQDRIIGKNTIVAPRSSEKVPVFCVEHGRWSGRKADFSSAEALAHTELRKKASFSDQGSAQGAVWSEVADKNAKRKLSNDTDTYRAVAQDKSVKRSVAGYDKAIRARMAAQSGAGRMVGFAVALDGKVVAIETFASPALFAKLRDKLLHSYFVEAVDHKFDPAKPAAAPPAEAIGGFAAKARKAKRQVVREGKAGKTVQLDSDENMKGSLVEAEDGAPVYQSAHE